MVHDTGHIQKCLKSLKSWKSFHLRKTFSWFCSKLLTKAEIEGGFLLVGDQWSLKKNQTQKLNRGLRWFTTRKLLPSTFPNNFWATFRKRDLDFFVFKSASESPFYRKWVSKKIPLAAIELAWVAICWPFTFLLLCTPSLCLTHLCFCKDIQMHTIHTSRYLCDSWAKSSYIQKKWKSKLCWQYSWKGIRWWVRTKSEKSILRHYMYQKISFLSDPSLIIGNACQ